MIMQKRMPLLDKINEISLNEAVRGWHPPVQGKLCCPFCQSDQVYRRMRHKQGMTHICRGCEQLFSEELIRKCRCVRPGMLTKCMVCPQYQGIQKLMKANVEQLRYLPEAKVDQIMNHPDFYQEDFSVQQVFPQLKLECYAERKAKTVKVIDPLNPPIDYNNVEQLSLFE